MTFLFTDIESSTRLFQVLGPRYPAVLERHRRALRAAFQAHGGTEIDTQGDSFFVAFGRAQDALAACVDAQRALLQERWEPDSEIRVRMGLHAGEVEPVEDGYVALEVHQAARIAGAAHGGQVLVSQAVAELVGGEHNGIEFEALGLYRLKDFDEPQPLYQLVQRELTRDFPALRAPSAAAHNIVTARTSFIGRDDETASLNRMLVTSRLTTVVGAGGTGKTRLATHCALESVSRYEQGAWFLELAPLRDHESISAGLASLFGVRDAPGRTLRESLIEWLEPRELLLILDNCEHLVEATAELVDLVLGRCPHATILATSREPLGVAGEQLLRLAPLPPPNGQGALVSTPSVRLFLDRAAAVRPTFQPDERELEAIGAICRSLDGLPLAIELAAARVAALPPSEIAARIQDHALLKSRERGVVQRHRTLTELIHWSYELLPEHEQKLFRNLAVFSGGFDLDAAAAINSALGTSGAGQDVASDLASLCEKSLVVPVDHPERARFTVLETIRQYGIDRLQEAGEEEAAHEAHAGWASTLAAEANKGMRGPDQIRWLTRLEDDRDNLRAALTWLHTRGLARQALQLAVYLGQFWWIRGPFEEGLRWLHVTLESTPEDELVVRGLAEASRLAYGNAAHDESRRLGERAIALGRELNCESSALPALRTIAQYAEMAGDSSTTRELFTHGLALARASGDLQETAFSLINLALSALVRGELTDSRRLLDEALDLAEQIDPRTHQIILSVSGGLAYSERRFEDARAAQEEAVALARQLGDAQLLGLHLYYLGLTSIRLDDVQTANTSLEEALRISRAGPHPINEAATLWVLGELALHEGRTEEAIVHACAGLRIAQEHGDMSRAPYHFEVLAKAWTELGESERAVMLSGIAANLRNRSGEKVAPPDSDDMERAMQRVRRLLGSAFDEAYKQGLQMEDARAFVYALEHGH